MWVASYASVIGRSPSSPVRNPHLHAARRLGHYAGSMCGSQKREKRAGSIAPWDGDTRASQVSRKERHVRTLALQLRRTMSSRLQHRTTGAIPPRLRVVPARRGFPIRTALPEISWTRQRIKSAPLDEYGEAVHEACYIKRLALDEGTLKAKDSKRLKVKWRST